MKAAIPASVTVAKAATPIETVVRFNGTDFMARVVRVRKRRIAAWVSPRNEAARLTGVLSGLARGLRLALPLDRERVVVTIESSFMNIVARG